MGWRGSAGSPNLYPGFVVHWWLSLCGTEIYALTKRHSGSDHRGRERVLLHPQGLPGTAGRGPACPVVWEAGGEIPPPTRLSPFSVLSNTSKLVISPGHGPG